MISSINSIASISSYGSQIGSDPVQDALSALADIMAEINDMKNNPQNAQADWAKIENDIQNLKKDEPNLNPAQQQVINAVFGFFGPNFPTDPSQITPEKMAGFLQLIDENLYKFH